MTVPPRAARTLARRAPSMADVARRAGVSLGTVSHALNKPEIVAPKTLERIDAAIGDLGYVRNRTARSLAAGDSGTVGLVLVDLSNSFFVEIAKGAEKAVGRLGMSLLLANADVDLGKQDRYLELFDETRMSGIILAPLDAPQVQAAQGVAPPVLETARRVRDHGRSVVLVNYAADDFCGVVVDEEHGGYLAARHLLEAGRSRLAFAGGPLTLRALAGRWAGVQRAAVGAGVTVEHVPTDLLNQREGRRVARKLADRRPEDRPDGLVMAADSLAVGCIQELRLRGVEVPQEIAVTGYDDDHLAYDAPIPVTTVRQPGREMGEEAAALLQDEAAGSGHRHRTVVLEPELVVRESTTG